MEITRRAALRLGVALYWGWGSAAAGAGGEVAQAFGRRLVLLGPPPSGIEADTYETLLRAFPDRGIPVACVLPGEEGPRLRLARLAARERGLIEVVAPIPDSLDVGHRHFHLRAANDIRAGLAATFASADVAAFPIVTVANDDPDRRIDLPAFRSAGFRVLLEPASAVATAVSDMGSGQVVISGGHRVDPVDDPAWEEGLEAALAGDGDRLIAIRLAGISGHGGTEAIAALARLAARLEKGIADDALFFARPVDLALQEAGGGARHVALVLEDQAGSGRESLVSFAGELEMQGLPFSWSGECPRLDGSAEAEPCLSPLPLTGSGRPERQDGYPSEKAGSPCCDATGAPPFASLDEVVLAIGPRCWTGLRPDARFQIAARPLEVHRPLGGGVARIFEEGAILIGPDDVRTVLQRRALVGEILDGTGKGELILHTLEGLAGTLLPPDPIRSRLWSTWRRAASDPPMPRLLSPSERNAYMADARLAWSYIETFTDPETGLCAGTVQGGVTRQISGHVTLWDVASQIQGITAAQRLGLLDAAAAAARIRRAVSSIPTERIGDAQLPPAIFEAATRRSIRAGFDICDAGRFLIALRTAVRASLLTVAEAHALVARWDLGHALPEGRLHNHNGRRWIDVTASHCTAYVAPALLSFGHSVSVPLPALGRSPSSDEMMRMLYAAAAIGPYGTEPVLLETVESMAGPEAKLLGRLLFDAQLDWYERTGELKAVSEAPLNFPPWFTYQGLRLDRTGAEAWVKSTISRDESFRSEEFFRRIELISAKSAYLWAVAYPHPYSDRLVSLIRDRARMEGLGFSVGVFAQSGRAMVDYTDLNTNGIILAGIAKLLEA